MPPRSVSQSQEIRSIFRAKIKEKVAREKAALRQRVDDEVPSWLAWAVKPERAAAPGVGLSLEIADLPEFLVDPAENVAPALRHRLFVR